MELSSGKRKEIIIIDDFSGFEIYFSKPFFVAFIFFRNNIIYYLTKEKEMTVFYIVAGAAVLYFILAYNGLVAARQRVKEGAADIDTLLKRRYDLIPNLVETVKGYAAHEKQTLEQVVSARSQAMNTSGLGEDKTQVENALSGTLKSLFAISESYPDLKANQNFLELQQELSDTENKIQASRRFYNSTVLAMNTKVESFPANIVAKMFGFSKEAFFELSEEEKKLASQPPKVSF